MNSLIAILAVWIAINVAIGIWLLSGKVRPSRPLNGFLRRWIQSSTTDDTVRSSVEVALKSDPKSEDLKSAPESSGRLPSVLRDWVMRATVEERVPDQVESALKGDPLQTDSKLSSDAPMKPESKPT